MDEDKDLDRERIELRGLLEDDDWVVGSGVDHIAERLGGQSEIRYNQFI